MKVEPKIKIEKQENVEDDCDEDFCGLDNITAQIARLSVSLGSHGNNGVSLKESDDLTTVDRGPVYGTFYKEHHSPYFLPPNRNSELIENNNQAITQSQYSVPNKKPSSQLFLSGGTQIAEVDTGQERQERIYNYLKEDTEEYPLDFDDPLFNDVPDVNVISDLPEDLTDYLLDNLESDHSESTNNSGRNSVSSDLGVVSSPQSEVGYASSSGYESASPGTYETSDVPDPDNTECQFKKPTSNATILKPITSPTPKSTTCAKTYQPIYPKPSTSVNIFQDAITNPVETIVTKGTRSKIIKTPKDNFLSKLEPKERDKYHKKMLKLSKGEGGLGKKDTEGRTYLHALIIRKDETFAIYFIHLLEIWLQKMPNDKCLKDITSVQSFINCVDNEQRSPLYYCSLLNLPYLSRYLLQCGADPNLADTESMDTPLHFASQRGKTLLAIVSTLCDAPKIDLDQKNIHGQTALHQATQNHLLLHKDDNLHTSEVVDSKPIIERLLRSGARLAVQDDTGRTPIHLAVQLGNLELLELQYTNATDWSAAINIRAQNGFTVLHEAMTASLPNQEIREEVLKQLVIYEASGDIRDNEGRLPNWYRNSH